MEQNHHMNFAEYERNLNKKIEVERRREKSYQDSKKILTEVNNN